MSCFGCKSNSNIHLEWAILHIYWTLFCRIPLLYLDFGVIKVLTIPPFGGINPSSRDFSPAQWLVLRVGLLLGLRLLYQDRRAEYPVGSLLNFLMTGF